MVVVIVGRRRVCDVRKKRTKGRTLGTFLVEFLEESWRIRERQIAEKIKPSKESQLYELQIYFYYCIL